MAMRSSAVGKIITVLIIGAFVLFCWSVFFPHRYESTEVLSGEEAVNRSPIALPDAASNVRVATYTHWVAYSQYVRFEAPTPVCLAHAKAMTGQEPPAPKALDEDERRCFHLYFADGLPWFDTAHIRNGVVLGGGPSVPKVWVDTDRGIFYYQITD